AACRDRNVISTFDRNRQAVRPPRHVGRVSCRGAATAIGPWDALRHWRERTGVGNARAAAAEIQRIIVAGHQRIVGIRRTNVWNIESNRIAAYHALRDENRLHAERTRATAR